MAMPASSLVAGRTVLAHTTLSPGYLFSGRGYEPNGQFSSPRLVEKSAPTLLVDGRRQVQATEEDLTSMATLADSFLADLDDLSDDDDVADEPVKDEPAEDGVKAEAAEGPIGGVDFRYLDAVAKLVGGERYRRVISQVDDALAADAKKKEEEGDASTGPGSTLGVVDEGAYQLIVDCNALSVEIENEIQVVHNFIRDRYRAKFPELESLVMHPIDYARVVKVIGNEMDMTRVELESVLPNATIMVVSVTGSTTNGQPLSAEDLEATVRACDVQLQLDADKRKLVALVEARMDRTAPNLSAVLGPEVASKLMSVAGGLVALSKMPANNVQVLGQKRKAAAGMSSATAVKSGDLHVGFINQCDIIQRKTPPPLRMRAARLVAGKCTLMARVDAFGEDPSGTTGRGMHTEMVKKIEKWQEPPPRRGPPSPSRSLAARRRSEEAARELAPGRNGSARVT